MRRTVSLPFLSLCVMGLALMASPPACAGPFPKDTIFATATNTADLNVIWMVSDTGIKEFARIPPGDESDPWIGPLAFSPSGDLYVVTRFDTNNTGALWKVTKGGDLTSDKPMAVGLFPEGASKKYGGLVFDPAGNAYIANGDSGTDPQPILRVDPTGKVTQLTGVFENPHGLAVLNDTLYIGESNTGRVLAYNLKDNTVKPFATGFVQGTDHVASQLAVDPRGHLLVLWKVDPDDEHTPGLFDITAGGDFAGKSPIAKGTFRLDMNQIAVDSKNNVYVAGNDSHRVWISRFSADKFADFVELNGGDVGDSEAIAIAP
jgi:WD40 repeat protein